ncbi:MAG: hypothetical protein K0S47_1280 [Herbinix sp.]|jgi:hypothetical protein|nr:hypothetical protein [Herbinix sp.]
MNFYFDGNITREVLNNYLARAVTHCGIGEDNSLASSTFEDDLRMLKEEGAKFIGRASYVWSKTDDARHFQIARERAARAHGVDPEFILQACVFECIEKSFVNSIKIPTWVFEAFGVEIVDRHFNYDNMLFKNGKYINQWGEDFSVEDINQLESRLWIYYRACSYIDAGFEGIHFGQVHLIGAEDEGFRYFKQVIGMIREYAAKHARRHYVLCDAHTHGISVDGISLFDYNAFPIRLKEVLDKPMECVCEEEYLDSLFSRSAPGVSPSGWSAEAMPFIVEFDNFGRNPNRGVPNQGSYFTWGYDEITWFALLRDEARANFLRYIDEWVNSRYPEGWVQMPSRRIMTESIKRTYDTNTLLTEWLEEIAAKEYITAYAKYQNSYDIYRWYYSANRPSDACPFGFGDEEVIRELFLARTVNL